MEQDSGFGYFLLGLGIGIAAGVLWAPQAGGETRQLIADKVGESADYMRRLANSLKNLSAAVEAGKQAYRAHCPTSKPQPLALQEARIAEAARNGLS